MQLVYNRKRFDRFDKWCFSLVMRSVNFNNTQNVCLFFGPKTIIKMGNWLNGF